MRTERAAGARSLRIVWTARAAAAAATLCLVAGPLWAAEAEKFEVRDAYVKRRSAMVTELKGQGVQNAAALSALGTVPREEFARPGLRFRAYIEQELPVEHRQFLSRPSEWARALELLDIPNEARVLVFDPGIGYAAALVSKLAREVCVVVTVPELFYFVEQRFKKLAYSNVLLRAGALADGWPERAPYDRIFIAGVPAGEIPQALFDQLAPEGHALAVEGGQFQNWVLHVKSASGVTRQVLDTCHFPSLEGS